MAQVGHATPHRSHPQNLRVFEEIRNNQTRLLLDPSVYSWDHVYTTPSNYSHQQGQTTTTLQSPAKSRYSMRKLPKIYEYLSILLPTLETSSLAMPSPQNYFTSRWSSVWFRNLKSHRLTQFLYTSFPELATYLTLFMTLESLTLEMQRSRIMATNVSFFNDEAVWRKLAIGISNLRKLEEFALIAHESDKPDVSAYQNILTSSTNVANLKSVNLMLSKDTVSQIQKILRESELKTLTLNFHEGGENYETMVETLAGALQNTKKLSRVLFYIPFDSSDAVYEILFRHLMPNTLRMLDISYSKTSSPPGSLKFFEFNGTFNSPESKLQITIPTTNGVITQSLNVFRKPASWLKIHVNVDVNDLKTIFNSINPDKLIDIFIICNKFINLNVLR